MLNSYLFLNCKFLIHPPKLSHFPLIRFTYPHLVTEISVDVYTWRLGTMPNSINTTLKSVIENNASNVDLFVVEVGARGYYLRLFLCCFKSLGLRNCTINTTIKQLSI